MAINWKDVLIRALKTFWQTAFSYIALNLANLNFFDGTLTKKVLVGFALSALASGWSAAWNAALKPVWEKLVGGSNA